MATGKLSDILSEKEIQEIKNEIDSQLFLHEYVESVLNIRSITLNNSEDGRATKEV